VKEVGKNVIFLRKLAEGGVAHSFGLHVARMAGMPKQVLDSAEKTLAALEKTSGSLEDKALSGKKHTVKPHNVREGRVESDGSLQLSFFQLEDPLLASLKEDLDAVDMNNLTPLQAFDVLRSLKEKMGLI
jgi:DNA mismatch repair protein MutS